LSIYFGGNGVLTENYSGVGTQTAGLRFGSVMFLSEEVDCSSPDASEDCSVTTDISGSNSASAGGGAGGGFGTGGAEGGGNGDYYDQYPRGGTVPMNPRNVGNMSRSNDVQNSQFRAAANRAYQVAKSEGLQVSKFGDDELQQVHHDITKLGYGFHDNVDEILARYREQGN